MVLLTTQPSGLGSLTNPSRGQKKLFAGKVFVSENEMSFCEFVFTKYSLVFSVKIAILFTI